LDDGRNRLAWVSRASARRALPCGVLVPCLVWALVSVAPAWSAELVQVRVGNHPTFTRVVFEFDAATGYRIERRAEGEAENVIVVTLDAASRPRNIISRSPGVKSVSVEEGFDHAIARVSTRKPGMPIKEMILSDPPRIVLDLMLGKRAPAVAPPEPAPAVIEPELVSAPAVAEPEPEPVPVIAEPEPEPAPIIAEPERVAEPAPEPEVPAVEPASKPEVADVEPEPTAVEPAPAPEPEPAAAETEFEPEVIAEPVAPPESVVDWIEEEAVEVEETARVAKAERAPEARLAAEAESREAPFDIASAGMIAGGALALILVIFLVVRRRRALPNDMDVTALAAEGEGADEASDDGRILKGGFSMDAPGSGEAHPAEDFELGDSEQPSDEGKPLDSIATGSEVAPGLFHEAPHEKEAMTMENQDVPNMQMDSEAATQLGAGAGLVGAGEDSDIARIVQELERRVAHLETRLDESIDARERLERQVAAQSEELRVQRAAIARTQRALRSLNRTEEDQATEPALRDPSKPAGPQ